MKGKISCYFNAPNVNKVRTRVDNPTKEFSSKVRQAIQKAAVEVLNENILSMRAKLIKAFSEMGENPKDAKAAGQLTSVLNPYFDVVCSETPFSGGDEEETEEKEEAKEDPQPKKGAKKDSDEFTD